jgi:hypothetical protein
METLISFLKSSSVPDLLVILLVVLIAAILIPLGIWTAIASRSRKPIYLFLVFALVPFILAILGTFLRLSENERALRMFPDASPEIVAASNQEAWITTYIGAAGTAVLGLIGVAGLVFKKESEPSLNLDLSA